MTDWECPNCRGGFPDPEKLGECPWCGQPIDGSYEFESGVMTRVIADDGEDETAENSLFGWLKG